MGRIKITISIGLIKMYNRVWNAPPIRGTTFAIPCGPDSYRESVPSVVKNINRIRIRAGTIRTWETEWTGKAPPGNIRGKPFALHDTGSLPGGRRKKIMPEKEQYCSCTGTTPTRVVWKREELCP
jgi:hypothetical protein